VAGRAGRRVSWSHRGWGGGCGRGGSCRACHSPGSYGGRYPGDQFPLLAPAVVNLLTLFDANGDLKITVAELKTNSFLSTLLHPMPTSSRRTAGRDRTGSRTHSRWGSASPPPTRSSPRRDIRPAPTPGHQAPGPPARRAHPAAGCPAGSAVPGPARAAVCPARKRCPASTPRRWPRLDRHREGVATCRGRVRRARAVRPVPGQHAPRSAAPCPLPCAGPPAGYAAQGSGTVRITGRPFSRAGGPAAIPHRQLIRIPLCIPADSGMSWRR
jgi:hypothetical protein